MTSLFQRNLSAATLFQLGADASWLIVAALLALHYDGKLAAPVLNAFVPALVFAFLVVSLNGAFGLYRRDTKLAFGTCVARMFLALLIGVPMAYLAARLLPQGAQFQEVLGEQSFSRSSAWFSFATPSSRR